MSSGCMLSECKFWILYGVNEYIYDEGPEELDLRNEELALAIFSSPDKAREFGEACKTPKFDDYVSWRSFDPNKQFRKKTILNGFQRYCVKPLWQKSEKLIIDPKP